MDDIRRPKRPRPHIASPTRRQFEGHKYVDQALHLTHQEKRTVKPRLRFKLVMPFWMQRFARSLLTGKLFLTLRSFLPSRRKYPLLARVGWALLAVLMVGSIFIEFFNWHQAEAGYVLSQKAQTLISRANPKLEQSLKFDAQSQAYQYNQGYKPGGEVAGMTGTPKFTARFSQDPAAGATVTDPVNSISVGFKPQFNLDSPKQDANRLVYPLKGRDAQKVYSLKSIGMKEDIILNSFQGDEQTFIYKLELSEGAEARLESNGGLAIYGPRQELLGDISTGTDADADLLKKARQNSAKTTLLFTFPAPFVKEFGKHTSNTRAWFVLKGDMLELHASGLGAASYPLTIDPSVYIESASKLMRGNNETNIDFDIEEELIQKSQTTGARIDRWQGNMDMSAATWDHGMTAAGGYVYRAGGRTGNPKPWIAGQASSTQATNSATFTMAMPTYRPAGDLYIAMMCHDGTGAPTAPGGWTTVSGTDTDEFAAYYKIGTDQGGGSESGSYNWTGITEQWKGVVVRVTGFDSGDIFAGTVGTANTSGNVTFPAATPDENSTLVIRGVGIDNLDPSENGWVPTGHTKIDSGSSSADAESCGFTAASIDVPPVSGVSTGSTQLAQTLSTTYGGMTFAIAAATVTPTTQSALHWAKFNSSTSAIESPNPGNGACTEWCTNSAYDLPSALRGFSLVAYNGYLYVIGGVDGSGNRVSTVYVAKLGANGEPSLWHPSGGTAEYWYTGSSLSGPTARSYMAAVAYNNRLYILGGSTVASPTGTDTMEYAAINPAGTLGTWTSGTALPSVRYKHTAHIYNDVLYLLGGDSAGTLQNAVHYNKLNSDGTMNAWTATTAFTTARSTNGGNFSAVWGAYLYLGGGCSTTTGASNYYCSTEASDTQIASLNADGTISEWASLGILNQRSGYSFLAWQGGLYRSGGCIDQNTSTGECSVTVGEVDYGVVNPAGEVSTVNVSSVFNAGVDPCDSSSPHSCDLPPAGDDAGEAGQMLSMSTILNGYLYVIGGCISYDCNSADSGAGDDADLTGNTAFVAIDASGRLVAPPSCAGTSYGAWCTDATNRINTTIGVAAAGVTTFNNRIYIVGGLDDSTDGSTNIYYNTTDSSTGALSGAWSTTSFATAGIGTQEIAYTYAYARANPSSAGTNPGNLYIFGGCGDVGTGAGCSSSSYRSQVYKCNIAVAGGISGCTTTGQLQIDAELADDTNEGLGIHSGTIYANYIYLIGGFSAGVSDRDTVFYAKFDNSNNVVDVTSGAVSGADDDWIESASILSVGRRRGFAFGYNGHVYAVGGYDDSGIGTIPFIEWGKMNVSSGDVDPFQTSNVQITQRWGLSMIVSNGYSYVIGGCDVGTSPGGCSSFERSLQTFQLYNNDSGAVNNFTANSNNFTTATDRIGASAAVLNGYLYIAGGCTTNTADACTAASSSVQYAAISASDGTLGAWSAGGSLPAARTWGSLETAGGTLYYLGGQDSTASNEQTTVYYTTGISSGNPTWSGSAASNGLPAARTRLSSAVWNNRLYVVGGLDSSAAVTSTVYVSPQLNSGGDITSAWASSTAFNVARTGAAVTAYANNLYLFGGFDGTNYLSDVQFTQINSDGTVDSWTYTTSLPGSLRDAQAVSVNGYIYLVGGRSAATTCVPNTIITPVSANTTITTGNNPTGIGEWYETNIRYGGDRYGAAVAYDKGKIYTMGGGCADPLSSNRHYYSTVKSQPQVAKYSRMIDTDTDVFPNSWLMNGLDNSIGARWAMRYSSMNDTDGVATDCGTADMTTWGQDTNFGDVTLGKVEAYTPKDGSGNNINCARYYYFSVSIDASKTFGYPEDVSRGPTITDLSLFFTSDPSKRLRHGKTFTGGEQQPLDTPCRQSNPDPNAANCPLP